ncbi:zinc-ribbon domain-containing protein [Youngiibacter multivorans]|uniref:SsDNA-binding Zn-finger/Zn-ribbon topoisomerase 1 n=1 Tax=Youngiibacter multivorans TaxID=937251 RepID=A0ABS4G8T0_9CLOT|nr:zinc-ribbon domain containing protein [Youngiibacter multivorans]MBP1920956.1 ssDNA-binding Zn-finger/Zn-ribbon topoisomerase 1 [Youngiibacter multivorans]
MSDKHITCKDCQDIFTFTVGEQEYYQEKDFNDPVRCPRCRKAKKAARDRRDND